LSGVERVVDDPFMSQASGQRAEGDPPPIRILLVRLPRMLSDLITDIVRRESDVAVVGDLADAGGVGDAITRTGASFVIVGLDDGDLPAAWVPVLRDHPTVRLLGLSAQGRTAYLYELRPHAVPVGELSTDLLVDLVRATATNV
jgi:hypothetical protein